MSSPLNNQFIIPTFKAVGATKITGQQSNNPCIYLAGNSLGALSKLSEQYVREELNIWGTSGVEGHFDHPHDRAWAIIQDKATPILAEIVGAKEKEVACMSTLTANLHLMMNTFYKPTSDRYKILCEAKAFPSDQYAFASQARAAGYGPDAILELSPREGEHTLRLDDILSTLIKEGPSIAVVILSGVQYYTGQFFPIEAITKAAKQQGCICGWDLAHAVGNVPLSLHDWDVDFAVWCSYKYLNSGPGGIGGLYMHEKWNDKQTDYAGWWGHDPVTRFAMPPTFSAIPGAQGYQQSNPSVFATASLLGSLHIFKEAGLMPVLRARSLELTGFLEKKLHESKFYVPSESNLSEVSKPSFTIITPSDPASRGAQLSLVFLPNGNEVNDVMRSVSKGLASYGVVGDKREPDVIRLAPTPLYNTLGDCERAASVLEEILAELQ